MMPASGGTGVDLRWRSFLRLSPAPPIYEVMGDHGSPAGTSVRLSLSRDIRCYIDSIITSGVIPASHCHVDIRCYYLLTS